MKKEQSSKQKNLKSGFTLLELLVAVLIVGILAAIMLPQYKFAVAKSQYATLKNITKSLKEAVDRYYLANATYPGEFSDLDIDLNIEKTWHDGDVSFYIVFPGARSCEVYYSINNRHIICQKIITGKIMSYSTSEYPETEKLCGVYSTNTSDISNRVCQSETGKKAAQAKCNSSRCIYYY